MILPYYKFLIINFGYVRESICYLIATSSHNPTKKPTAAIRIIIHSTRLVFRSGSYNSNGETSFLKKEKTKAPKKHNGSRKSFIPRKKYAINTITVASDRLEPYFFIRNLLPQDKQSIAPFSHIECLHFLKKPILLSQTGHRKTPMLFTSLEQKYQQFLRPCRQWQ